MNKASCHATLTLLDDRNYLIRHADKTYSLGPGMLPIANSFLHDQTALPFARVEMTKSGRELNLDCVASSVVGSEIVILAHTPSPCSFGINMRVGSRFPLVPPIGTVFLAWASRDRVQQWLASVQVTPAKRARTSKLLQWYGNRVTPWPSVDPSARTPQVPATSMTISSSSCGTPSASQSTHRRAGFRPRGDCPARSHRRRIPRSAHLPGNSGRDGTTDGGYYPSDQGDLGGDPGDAGRYANSGTQSTRGNAVDRSSANISGEEKG